MLNLIGNSIKSQFDLPNDDISLRGMTYTVYNPGQGLPVHDDWKVSKFVVYSAILYLNDNYEGGEFRFYDSWKIESPETNTYKEYKPECGQLFYFIGDHEALHEVLPVISGERTCLIMFFAGNVVKPGVDEFDGTWGKS